MEDIQDDHRQKVDPTPFRVPAITRVYLAGAIAGINSPEAAGWRDCVSEFIYDNIRSPVCVRNPMVHGLDEGRDNPNDIAEWGIQEARRADVIVADIRHPSPGTAIELHVASAVGPLCMRFLFYCSRNEQVSVFFRRFMNEKWSAGNFHLLDPLLDSLKILIDGNENKDD